MRKPEDANQSQDQNGMKNVQDSTPMRWEVNLLDLEKQDTESANWMANLPDSMSLAEVNMPGTHDTGATKMRGEDGVATQDSATQCQQLYPYEQLNMGVRAFDVRCDYTDDDNSDGSPDIVHGDSLFQCQNKDGSSMRLSNIMDDAKKFVTNHPTECIIVAIKADGWAGGNDGNVARAVEEYVLDEDYPLWRENRIPTLGEARGKIILLRRYEMGNHVLNSDIEEWELGFNLSSWDDYNYTVLPKALEIFSMDVDDGDKNSNTITQNKVYVQDYYSTGEANVKMAWLDGTIEDATKNSLTNKTYKEGDKTIHQFAYLFNFLSCKDKLSVARETNLLFMKDEAGKIVQGNTLGIVMFNYVDFKAARKVWQTNYGRTVSSVQQVLSSEQHGVSVSGKIQTGAELKLVPLTESDAGTEYATMKEALTSDKLLRGWNIRLVNQDGTDSSWEGPLSIRIKKQSQEKLDNLRIYYLDQTGKCRALETTIDGEELVFQIDSLGSFGVAQQVSSGNITNSDTNNAQNITSPETGDTANVFLYLSVLFMSVVLLICGVFRIKREI